MSILLSTGFYGFICSATKRAGQYISTFVSGATGWMIRNNGEAEFKSIYARDRIVTNEYVYNRIRVTEDEEVVTSNGKIASAIENGDGTYTVGLDLREGDINPFGDCDLLQGYYHDPGQSGVIHSLQRFTVQADPDSEDQSMIVTCEDGSIPYRHMIIVRVGNTTNPDRQAFIRISSRTNCQYFYDGIDSFAALDNPDNVKCAIGKADIGLIPTWAAHVMGSVRKWFGLIADGVILRGVFVLKSSEKTIEEELNGVSDKITEVETAFEIREGQISGKVTQTETYAQNAANSATAAAGSATNAAGSALISTTKASEVIQTAESFSATVTETTQKAVTDAVTGATGLIEEKVGTAVTQSAKEWKVEVMGSDADGNPNKILAAINASEEGIKIDGDRVEITGTLLAQIILATGLNINDRFVVSESGEVSVCGKILTSAGGTRIVIDPSTNSLKMYNDKNLLVGDLSFMSSEFGTYPKFELMRYGASDQLLSSSLVTADSIVITNYPADPRFDPNIYSCVLTPSVGLSFQKNNESGACYPKSNEAVWITKTSDVIPIHKGDIVSFNFPSWVSYKMPNAATNNGRKFYAKNIGNDFELSGAFRGANTANLSSVVDFKWGMSFILISDGAAWNVFFCS